LAKDRIAKYKTPKTIDFIAECRATRTASLQAQATPTGKPRTRDRRRERRAGAARSRFRRGEPGEWAIP
jgi:hypothetical protein